MGPVGVGQICWLRDMVVLRPIPRVKCATLKAGLRYAALSGWLPVVVWPSLYMASGLRRCYACVRVL